MTDEPGNLEELSTAELHERAVARAREKWDVGFFWRLIRTIPAAEMAAGNIDAGRAGVSYLAGLISDVLAERAGDPELLEALRPIYLDYLSRHAQDE